MKLINADCLEYLQQDATQYDTIFADPPDNIGLKYTAYNDKLKPHEYITQLEAWLEMFIKRAWTVWFSYNAKWTFEVGRIVCSLAPRYNLEAKPCVQTFTFGQNRSEDLGNGHRPLLRLRHLDAPLFPDAIRVESWRQQHGDKRADPNGRVPLDWFDFPRVTGNSRQRRSWHPTQLHEGLVERCIRLTTPITGAVLDPFAGTGTTWRVCNRLNMDCTLIEIDPHYCEEISNEHNLYELPNPTLKNSEMQKMFKVFVQSRAIAA